MKYKHPIQNVQTFNFQTQVWPRFSEFQVVYAATFIKSVYYQLRRSGGNCAGG